MSVGGGEGEGRGFNIREDLLLFRLLTTGSKWASLPLVTVWRSSGLTELRYTGSLSLQHLLCCDIRPHEISKPVMETIGLKKSVITQTQEGEREGNSDYKAI